VLQFEVMRMVLKHPYSRRKENHSVAYAASNVTVQEYLKTPLDFPTAQQLFQTDQYNRKYFEFYYYKLLEQLDDSMIGQSGMMGGFGSSMDQSNRSDSSQSPNGPSEQSVQSGTSTDEQQHASSANQTNSMAQYTDSAQSGTENTEYWDSNEYYANQINDKIETALANNSWGTIPSDVQELILATLKPKLNYREILRSFRASILSVNRVLTRMKPSRRYGFLYMGSRRDFGTKLLFAVDVSGSVGSHDVKKAFSIINQLFKYGIQTVDVVQFDADIKGKPLSLKKAKYRVKVIGRGGTDFQPVVDYIDQNKDYDGLIIFTDGWAPVPSLPKNRRTKILWLFNNEDNYLSMKEKLKPIGRSAFLKEA
jgi:predicted metal-dependent peptidase